MDKRQHYLSIVSYRMLVQMPLQPSDALSPWSWCRRRPDADADADADDMGLLRSWVYVVGVGCAGFCAAVRRRAGDDAQTKDLGSFEIFGGNSTWILNSNHADLRS